jgi:hypothetical protein
MNPEDDRADSGRHEVEGSGATIRVHYFSKNDPPDAWLDESTRAVLLAGPYVDVDRDGGAIAFMEIRPQDVKRLGEFSPGDEVCVESDDPTHAYDSETEDARRNTHVWWRAEILPTASTAKYTLDGEPVDLDDFLAHNAETFTENDVAAVRALKVGEEISYGGGAQAVSVLRRVE